MEDASADMCVHPDAEGVVAGGGLWRRLRECTPAPEVPELRLALGCAAALDRNAVRGRDLLVTCMILR